MTASASAHDPAPDRIAILADRLVVMLTRLIR
jgi:hypothetical protein